MSQQTPYSARMLDHTYPSTAFAPNRNTAAASPQGTNDILPFPGVNAWVRAASQCQFNINPLMVAAGLQIGPQGVPHIRREGLLRMMQQCVAQAAPKHHFPLLAGELFAFDYLPAIETFLTTSATMRDALPVLGWLSQFLSDIRMDLQETGDISAITIDVANPTCEHDRVIGYFIEMSLAGLNKFTKLTLGDRCVAIQIEVQHDIGPQRMACEQQFGAPILINQSRNAVVFKTALLDEPLPGAVPDLHRKAQQIIEQQLPGLPEMRISTQIENLFRKHPELMGQGIDRIADRLNMHPRTLQRRLREDGQVFGEIQARCRYEVAVTKLKSDQIDIESLSDQLGFSDRHSFTRAFKRWTALAPSEFRKQHLEQQQANRK